MDRYRRWAEATGGMRWWPATEPSARWVRVRFEDTIIAESYSPQLFLQYGPPPSLPTYYFSADEVDQTSLVDARARPDGSTIWSVEVNGKRVEDAAWTHPDPTGDLEELDGMITFDWMSELQWYEEEEKIFMHARDPYKRVDVAPSSRHVEVYVERTKLADSRRPLLLFETLLPTRYYLPPEDVRLDLLTPSDTVTMCPYKGVSRHWSFHRDGASHPDIAWAYPDPIPENPRIKDLVCFYNERVDLVVDGEHVAAPPTPWSV